LLFSLISAGSGDALPSLHWFRRREPELESDRPGLGSGQFDGSESGGEESHEDQDCVKVKIPFSMLVDSHGLFLSIVVVKYLASSSASERRSKVRSKVSCVGLAALSFAATLI
jgi:hypothetical protein